MPSCWWCTEAQIHQNKKYIFPKWEVSHHSKNQHYKLLSGWEFKIWHQNKKSVRGLHRLILGNIFRRKKMFHAAELKHIQHSCLIKQRKMLYMSSATSHVPQGFTMHGIVNPQILTLVKALRKFNRGLLWDTEACNRCQDTQNQLSCLITTRQILLLFLPVFRHGCF